METLRAENVAKRYGNKQALDGVTISAESGLITAILGPNGAGKTTLIRITMTLIHPDRERSPYSERTLYGEGCI